MVVSGAFVVGLVADSEDDFSDDLMVLSGLPLRRLVMLFQEYPHPLSLPVTERLPRRFLLGFHRLHLTRPV